MLKKFIAFIAKEKLVAGEQKVLAAVSGGVDSIVMCELLHRASIRFGIAHCNFRLRGKESDGDEQLASVAAKRYKVPFYKKSFDTTAFAKRKKLSIQEAARDLRYGWLKKVAREEGYDLIATAHHLDDSVETFFINILRGTGIAGLQGIPVKQGDIIRPLLFATKNMIREFAEEEDLIWREDSSNRSDKYLRNNLRHHLIPSLKKLNKGFEKTIGKELAYFKDAAGIFKKFIEEKKKEIVVEEGKNILLNIKKLQESGYAETVLHELLRSYDFTPETTELIAQRLYTTAGKKFFSPTYRLIKDRDFLILTPKNSAETAAIYKIDKKEEEINFDGRHLHLEVVPGNAGDIITRSPSIAYLDHAKLKFPLVVRKWKPGDSFSPLGMKGTKKLSDFFTDRKLSLSEKENVFVLESGGMIAWVIGYRIDERFRVLTSSKKILRITLT